MASIALQVKLLNLITIVCFFFPLLYRWRTICNDISLRRIDVRLIALRRIDCATDWLRRIERDELNCDELIGHRESDRNPSDKITDGSDGRIIITTHLISIHLISNRLQYWDLIFLTYEFYQIWL